MHALALMVLILALAGCASPRPAEAPAPSSPAQATAEKPVSTPVPARHGQVVSVNRELLFVVVDFSLIPMPARGQLMDVYRAGQKVGEVKISGPARQSNIAADILAGSAQVGDEVRER